MTTVKKWLAPRSRSHWDENGPVTEKNCSATLVKDLILDHCDRPRNHCSGIFTAGERGQVQLQIQHGQVGAQPRNKVGVSGQKITDRKRGGKRNPG